ncbi:hypothetical protein K439DRAFT_1640363 [Ramaria rubella]|nr:hypothetical protein K439DRAFT_1640363 [Ramaria rubella]
MKTSFHICIRNHSPPHSRSNEVFLRYAVSVFPPLSPYLLLKTPRVSAANATQLKDVKGLSVIGGIWNVALCFSEQTFGL